MAIVQVCSLEILHMKACIHRILYAGFYRQGLMPGSRIHFVWFMAVDVGAKHSMSHPWPRCHGDAELVKFGTSTGLAALFKYKY
jgi:hypothetical protein